jgi:serine protease DegQ
MQPDLLTTLSDQLSSLVARAAEHVVRVEGRRRAPASGVVWTADGAVVTAHHTLERDEDLRIGLPSGDEIAGEVVGRDPTTDLAVLRVGASGLAPAAWGDEAALSAGRLVVGVSRPGRSPRASLGMVARAAGEYRAPGGGRIERYIETTLDVHAGVSGSLVVGADGAAAGVATAGIVRGAAMVIPPSTLRRTVEALLSHGEVRRGYLGIATIPVALPAAVRESTGEEVGLLVTRVDPESPAARAGIQLGDALLSFGGAVLQDPCELLGLLAGERIGDAVPMRLLRAGEVKDVTVTIGARGRTS